jgi:hypothetical protein
MKIDLGGFVFPLGIKMYKTQTVCKETDKYEVIETEIQIGRLVQRYNHKPKDIKQSTVDFLYNHVT